MANPFLPLLLMGAGALALGAKKKKTIHCPALNPQGGQVEGINYVEVVTGGADSNATLPMIIVFHGLGDRGSNFVQFFESFNTPARLIFPDGIRPWKKNYAWFELRAKTEQQDQLAQQMTETADAVAPFIDTMAYCRPTIGKPIITGHSQGGMMVLAMATRHGRLVRAAVPVSAWLPQRLWSPRLPSTYAIHGADDRTVPYDRTANYYQTMISQGAPIHFTPLPGRGHGIGGTTLEQWMSTLAWLTEA